MQEIHTAANLDWIKYAIGLGGLLFTVVSGLIIYIFSDLKKDVQEIKKIVDSDHDKIIKLETDHERNHPSK